MRRAVGALVATAGLVAAANAQVTLTEVQRVDLDPFFNANTDLGSNPSAVAWDGTNAFVAGFDNFSLGLNTGILKISDVFGAQTTSEFGVRATLDGRGYSGLDIRNGVLAAAWDNNAALLGGISAYDAATTATNWEITARGGSGVGFDPGFGGVDSGVGWTTFGSGRRALQDTATGANIYTTADGMIINGTGTGTFWRDMNFAPNGDIWLREGNNVIQGVRSGGNSLSATNLVVDAVEADFVNTQNLAYVDGSVFGDFVIYNDRASGGTGQLATDVLKVIRPDGTAESLSLLLIGGGTLADGNGAYDFSWDLASETLAIVDFNNRNLHIFQVPSPGAATLLGLGGLLAFRRRR